MACGARGRLAMSDAVKLGGATRLFAIVGDPIAQVRSPAVYTERFARGGHRCGDDPAARARRAVRRDRCRRSSASPISTASSSRCRSRRACCRSPTRSAPTAACIGAVNALRREADGTWTGDMFDGEGFVQRRAAQGAASRGAARCAVRCRWCGQRDRVRARARRRCIDRASSIPTKRARHADRTPRRGVSIGGVCMR